MRQARLPLAASLALAEERLDLDLPSLGADDLPDERTIHALAGLYLNAELEDTGLVAAAELLADVRDTLSLATLESARKLDDFAHDRDEWPDRAQRERLFARVFGMGAGASAAAGNRGFLPQLAALCHALAVPARVGPFAMPRDGVAVEVSARALLGGLRAQGSAVVAARRINAQTRRALAVLADPGIGALVGGRGVWDTLRRLFGPDAPDLSRLVDRGQSGQQVLIWTGASSAALAAGRPLPPAPDPVVRYAAVWLTATGLETERLAA